MLFSEIYGTYYSTVSRILDRAVEGSLTGKEMNDIVGKTAFGESLLTIPAALKEQRWPLLDKNLRTSLRHSPSMPLTTLEKRWMKTLLQDPRIRLFNPSEDGLEDVEPLYSSDNFVFYDRYADGDPYDDEKYIARFQTILRAVKEKRHLRVRFTGRRGSVYSYLCVPYRLEYSPKDDKFRLLTSHNDRMMTINLARIREVELSDPCAKEEYRPVDYREKSLVMELTDVRKALDRAMLHFSDLEKETEKLDDHHYRITVWYKHGDEAELLIRILSFGPMLKVVSPEETVNQVRNRLLRQKEL